MDAGARPIGPLCGASCRAAEFLGALSCAYAIRTAFAAGHGARAYALYVSHLRLLTMPRTRKALLRLPLTPLLHLIKPKAYPFSVLQIVGVTGGLGSISGLHALGRTVRVYAAIAEEMRVGIKEYVPDCRQRCSWAAPSG